MRRQYRYYVVFGDKGFVGHVNTYDIALSIIAEQGGGFCKGAMNLEEVQEYKKFYSQQGATQKKLQEEYKRLMNDYMNGRRVRRTIEKRLVELAKLGVSD